MSYDGEVPKEILGALLRLEAKQVLRGFKSEIFPDMGVKEAKKIRQELLKERKKNELQNS